MSVGVGRPLQQPLQQQRQRQAWPSCREPELTKVQQPSQVEKDVGCSKGESEGGSASEKVFCSRGHCCKALAVGEDPYGGDEIVCNRCSSCKGKDGEVFFHCNECRYDLCRWCAVGNRLPAPVPVDLSRSPERVGRTPLTLLSSPSQQAHRRPAQDAAAAAAAGAGVEDGKPLAGRLPLRLEVDGSPTPTLSASQADAYIASSGLEGGGSNPLLVGSELLSVAASLFEGRDAAGDWRREEMERALAQLEKNALDLQRLVAAGFAPLGGKSEEDSAELQPASSAAEVRERQMVPEPWAPTTPETGADAPTHNKTSTGRGISRAASPKGTAVDLPRTAAAASVGSASLSSRNLPTPTSTPVVSLEPPSALADLPSRLEAAPARQSGASLHRVALEERLRLVEQEREDALAKASQAALFAESVGLKTTFDLHMRSRRHSSDCGSISNRSSTPVKPKAAASDSLAPSNNSASPTSAPHEKESFYSFGTRPRNSNPSVAARATSSSSSFPPRGSVATSTPALAEAERRLLFLSSTAASSLSPPPPSPSPSLSPSSVSPSPSFFESMKSESAKDVASRLRQALGRGGADSIANSGQTLDNQNQDSNSGHCFQAQSLPGQRTEKE